MNKRIHVYIYGFWQELCHEFPCQRVRISHPVSSRFYARWNCRSRKRSKPETRWFENSHTSWAGFISSHNLISNRGMHENSLEEILFSLLSDKNDSEKTEANETAHIPRRICTYITSLVNTIKKGQEGRLLCTLHFLTLFDAFLFFSLQYNRCIWLNYVYFYDLIYKYSNVFIKCFGLNWW